MNSYILLMSVLKLPLAIDDSTLPHTSLGTLDLEGRFVLIMVFVPLSVALITPRFVQARTPPTVSGIDGELINL